MQSLVSLGAPSCSSIDEIPSRGGEDGVGFPEVARVRTGPIVHGTVQHDLNTILILKI
jgi:hypothetical protein